MDLTAELDALERLLQMDLPALPSRIRLGDLELEFGAGPVAAGTGTGANIHVVDPAAEQRAWEEVEYFASGGARR